MKSMGFFFLCSLSAICGQVHYMQESKHYYWKYYTGKIPNDAVPGGWTRENKQTYIGQAFFAENILVPGYIDVQNKTLVYAMTSLKNTTKEGIKILCSPDLENFEWITTNIYSMRYLTQRELVQGGYDDGYPLLVGRMLWKGTLAVGKVTVNQMYEAFAFAVDDDVPYQKFNFEVLAYNPTATARNITLYNSQTLTVYGKQNGCTDHSSNVYEYNIHIH